MPPFPGQKSVLITGCTPGGIGHALALEFQKRDWHVFATARDPAVLASLASPTMSILQLDVTDSHSIATCHSAVSQATNGKLDILVNNAGCSHTHPALDIDLSDVRQTFETNVFGVMAMVARFGDLLIKAQGMIINIASLAAVTPYVFGSVFSATKGAIISYSRTLRQELRPFNVRVMVLMTGFVKSSSKKVYRALPENSFYNGIRQLFSERVTYSNAVSVMTAEEYASDIIDQALKKEVWSFLRSWYGRPDWYWSGGKATLVWWARALFGEWLTDHVSYKTFQLHKLESTLQHRSRS